MILVLASIGLIGGVIAARKIIMSQPKQFAVNTQNVEALARMLASETSKKEAWPWMASALDNAARARGITPWQLLTNWGKGWGSNKEGRWASTARNYSNETLDFASKWYAGKISPPAGSEGVRSFFEVDEHGVKHDPTAFLRRNPELVIASEVAGWQFYKRRNS